MHDNLFNPPQTNNKKEAACTPNEAHNLNTRTHTLKNIHTNTTNKTKYLLSLTYDPITTHERRREEGG
jgi:hypothetical protein